MEAAAMIHLEAGFPITPEVEQVIQQIAMPLQVALEREVIYRTIEDERRKAYQGSIRDSLTGLFNRVYMQDTLERHCSIHDRDETSPLAAVMIDLDHFKEVNDRYGHGAGDEVLRQIAQLLRDNVRESDVPVRYGGEEFILFLVGASAFGAAEHGERIRASVEQHDFQVADGLKLPITASLGVALRERYESLDSLIRRADLALYRAKEGGRNRVELAPPSDRADVA
jgi:diguanylate cyclase (GGDEF)-like protein